MRLAYCTIRCVTMARNRSPSTARSAAFNGEVATVVATRGAATAAAAAGSCTRGGVGDDVAVAVELADAGCAWWVAPPGLIPACGAAVRKHCARSSIGEAYVPCSVACKAACEAPCGSGSAEHPRSSEAPAVHAGDCLRTSRACWRSRTVAARSASSAVQSLCRASYGSGESDIMRDRRSSLCLCRSSSSWI